MFFGPMAPLSMADEPLDMKRFFHSGDGYLHLDSNKNDKIFSGQYRMGHDQYNDKAYSAISAVFGAPYQSGRRLVSMRLIEFLDYLEDRLKPGARITITSGYRAPAYNTKIRKKGALAAKASLHQYGMAADIIMEGVSSKSVWEYVRSIGFGGTGYYHGKTVHVDVGPARFWDQTSSGVGTGISDDNKLVGIIADFDRYRPGEMVTMGFIRMTAFPISVKWEFKLIPADDPGNESSHVSFRPHVEGQSAGMCGKFGNISQMAGFRWRLPSQIQPGRYLIRAGFCDNPWEKMPKAVDTPEFVIHSP